jgi:hypothetical protein
MFSTVASKAFPNVDWLGNSDIHVSVAFSATLPLGDSKAVIAILEKAGVASNIYRHLNKKFEGLTWLLEPAEFDAVFMVDCYNHLRGKSDSRSPNKLKNPMTGNYFHRIALKDDLVCGIRFWCDKGWGDDEVHFGFRFRIQRLDEEEEDTRRRTRDEALEAVEQLEQVHDFIFEMEEPPPKAMAQVQALLETM